MSEGNGHDLPFGCLLNDENLMYWNPRGVAISADKTIRIWKLDQLSFYGNNDDNTDETGICLRVLAGNP